MPVLNSRNILYPIVVCLAIFIFASPLDTSAKTGEVYIIKIEDYTISPITADYIAGAIDKAYEDSAECLIIELDTPGGLLSSTRTIVKNIMSAKVPVVVYIYPGGSRAGSAGVFITYASHIAAMAPSTNIGAAHPVQIGGGSRRSTRDRLKDLKDSFRDKKEEETEKSESEEQESQEPESEKLEAKEAEQVSEGGKVEVEKPKLEKQQPQKKESQEPGEEDIMGNKILQDTVAFIKGLAKERNRNIEWAVKSVTESASITESEALKINVVEIVAKDEEDLLKKLHGREVKIADKIKVLNTKNATLKYIDMNVRQRFLNAVVNPNIAYILLILGFYGLLYEITHPGIGFPGVAGAICIILAFYSMQTLAANYAGLGLIILGIILFIAEVKVPGFGLLTLGGLVCMILGSLILFETSEQIMRVSLSLIISFSLATAGITIVLVRAVIISHKRHVVSGKEGLIGEVGRAMTDILSDREAKVFIHGEIWDAVSNEDIKKGGKIEVVKVDGMTLEVKKVG